MDYIYSYLNDDVASREMHGSETNTAVVTVNAATNTISVDVKPISPSMLNITKPTESGSYILQETISEIGEVSYSWATLEDYNQEVTQAIANLTQQLEQEKQERIESVQAEANTRELADTQLRTEFTSEIAQEKQEREQAVSEEAQRTNSMINQLNDNVQSGFNTINNVLTTSINNINNAILNESTIREEQFDDTTFRIRDINTRLGVEIGNRESWDNIIYANLSAKIENEKRERVEQDQDIRDSISAEANSRQEALDELSNRIAGDIEEERQTRAAADETLQSNIDAETTERKSVDQHLWDILPDNIIAGTPMQGMEFPNAVNIVFSKYQKHGIGEDPADAELVEVPNQTITLVSATQEVAGILTAGDKTKIDNIATDIANASSNIIGDAAEDYNTLGKLEDAIQNEFTRANAAETQLQSNIEAETNRAEEAEKDLDDKLTKEISDREEAVTNLEASLKGDVSEDYNTLGKLEDRIQEEATRATEAETDIQADLDGFRTNTSHSFITNTNASVSITSTADSGSINITSDMHNPATNTTETFSISDDIPIATNTNAGFMSSAQVNELGDIRDRAVVKTGSSSQTINGDIAITGNLTVNGTTTTLDHETLTVKDAIIITNSGGANLNSALSGIAIRTGNESEAYGIVYNGQTDAVELGLGTVAEDNSFTFTSGEGLPVTVRENLSQANLIQFNEDEFKLVDSGIAFSTIALVNKAQTFADTQTFSKSPIIEVNNISIGGKVLTSNEAGNIATEAQITTAINNLVNGANTGYQTLSEIESEVKSVDSDLQSYKESTDQEIADINSNIDAINANTAQMKVAISSAQACASGAYAYAGQAHTLATNANTLATDANTLATTANTAATNAYGQANSAYSQANNAYSQANNAYSLADAANSVATNAQETLTNHIDNKDNPHQVTKAQVDLGNVDNVRQYSASNPPPYPVTSVAGRTGAVTLTKNDVGLNNVPNVNTANASNITGGSLATERIESGLVVSGNATTTTVSRNATTGIYTVAAIVNKSNAGLGNVDNVKQYSASNPPPYPVTSVANKTGAVQLNAITFITGACTATYNGASDVTVAIPNVPTLHSVSISTNNGSATTVVGNVYSDSATPIEISIPESQTITLANTYNANSGANGIVTGISLLDGVLTVSYGALDDGTL